ncbi:SPX domain-containing protein [Salix suchowensis]|uniref:SPX DOMAIN-CONTAINING PROTEIN 3 n=1 Tax=Salix koriyanagi TaxID=2511006 RepID=A0A9Q0W0Y2_9ROSI|nr:SPX domain-containing protein [Salix suchowensis]KAJ6758569.1 SPX DOMAIN-CONTAINING PROTEIN 3 [Salix koriyanagi]
MKFWKSLSNLMEETLPDWRDKFLSYKDLKKQLKLIYPKDGDKPLNKRPRLDDDQLDSGEVEKEVIDFVRVLEDEMEKFNSFIVEKEEDSVIKWKELQDRAEKAKDSSEELMKVGREIVDFHGEMVLLENYSALNYTGLVKILKKYDKRTGALVRVPFIQRIMQQPFYTTHVLNKLIKECESMLDHIFSRKEPSVSPQITAEISGVRETETSTESSEMSLRIPTELPEIEYMESMYVKLTLSALRVLKDIRSGSSTVSVYSLPPLQSKTPEGDWKKVNVLEQEAK